MPMDVQFELATSQTEGLFRQMLRDNPLAGNINLLLTREPNAFHAAAISGDSYELMLAFQRESRQLLGGGARFQFDAFINGKVMCVGYLGELRVQGGLKQRRQMLLNAYRAMHGLHAKGRAPFYITTIISDNTSTRRLLEAGIGDMPTYQPLEPLLTLMLPTRQVARLPASRLSVAVCRPGQLDDVAAALQGSGQDYQFHPVWTAESLRDSQRCRGISADDFAIVMDDADIRGVCCLWDQRAFKQTVVAGYSPRLARLRPFYNVVSPIIRQPKLPVPGEQIQSAFISHLSVAPNDEESLLALLRHAALRAAEKGIDYLVVGFAKRNPLSQMVLKRFSCHQYESMMYVVYWDDGREIASTIDGRMPHPEVAIL